MNWEAIRELAALVEARVGHVIREDNLKFLAETVARRCSDLGIQDLSGYVGRLRADSLGGEWDWLLEEVLVHESYLFRGARQLQVFAEEVLPELARALEEQRRLRLWSAGCSRGEEAVTLAILLAESPALRGWRWRILATDVDPAALEAARAGLYGGRSVREVPGELLARYFEPVGGGQYRVRRELLGRIDYRLVNLVREPLEPPGGPFDAIFLRNVLIYFRAESQKGVVERMAGLLAPHGYLVPGPTESLWQVTDSVVPVERSGVYFYRAASSIRPLSGGEGKTRRTQPAGGSGERKKSPSPSPPSGKRFAQRSGPEPQPPAGDAVTTDPLTSAVEAVLTGRLDLAQSLLENLKGPTAEGAAAYGLLGLIAECRGENPREVMGAYRRALFLEPRWFQLRLLLADLLWEQGERDRARGEYRRILGESSTNLAFPHALELGLPNLADAVRRARSRLREP